MIPYINIGKKVNRIQSKRTSFVPVGICLNNALSYIENTQPLVYTDNKIQLKDAVTQANAPYINNAPYANFNGVNSYAWRNGVLYNNTQIFCIFAEFISAGESRLLIQGNSTASAEGLFVTSSNVRLVQNAATTLLLTPYTNNTIGRAVIIEGLTPNSVFSNTSRRLYFNSKTAVTSNTSITYNTATRAVTGVNAPLSSLRAGKMFQLGAGNYHPTQQEIDDFIDFGLIPTNNFMHVYNFAEGKGNTIYDRNASSPLNLTIVQPNNDVWQRENTVACRNYRFGCDVWLNDTDSEYIFVPLAFDGSSRLGEGGTFAGHTWVRKIPANVACGIFKELGNKLYYPENAALITADTLNHFFTIAGYSKSLSYTDIEAVATGRYFWRKLQDNITKKMLYKSAPDSGSCLSANQTYYGYNQ